MLSRSCLFVFFLLVAFLFSACQYFSPEVEEEDWTWDYVEANIFEENNLVSYIQEAQQQIQIAFFSLGHSNGSGIINALNLQAENYVLVELLVDEASLGALPDLDPTLQVKGGNLYGNMMANFIVLDGREILQLFYSSPAALDKASLGLRMADLELIQDYQAEFYQMFNDNHHGRGSDGEDGKVRINFHEEYIVGENHLEVFFTPAQPFHRAFQTALGSAVTSAAWTFAAYENTQVYGLWNDVQNSGLSFKTYLGLPSSNSLKQLPNLQINGTYYLQDPAHNALFVDIDDAYKSTAVMTSGGLPATSALNQDDLVVVKTRGPINQKLFDLEKTLRSRQTRTNHISSNQLISRPSAQYDIIVNEYLRRGLEDGEGDRYALAKFIELKNTTSLALDISGCSIIITNGNRRGEPATLNIPYGTILQSGEVFVIAAQEYAFSHYDFLWKDFYIDNTYTMTVVDSVGNVLDHLGDFPNPLINNSDWSFWRGDYGETLNRSLPPDDGTEMSSWSETNESLGYFDQFLNHSDGTPGTP